MFNRKTGYKTVLACLVILASIYAPTKPASAEAAPAAEKGTIAFESVRGGLLTWLVSDGVPIPPAKGFDADLLEDFGGEASLHPNGLVTEQNGNKLYWRVLNSRLQRLSPAEIIPQEPTAYYMFTAITPQKSGTYTLSCEYWPFVRVWIDGKEVLSGTHYSRYINVDQAQVDLQAGKKHNILVKIAGQGGSSSIGLELTDPTGQPASFKGSLPVPDDQRVLAGQLSDALSVATEHYIYFDPERTSRLVLGVPYQRDFPPGFDSELNAKVSVLDSHDMKLDEIDLGKVTPNDLRDGVRFQYRPTEEELSPYYKIQVELSYKGEPAARFTRNFYCIKGIRNAGDDVRKRAEKFYKESSEAQIYQDRNLAYLLLQLEKLQILYDKYQDSPSFGRRAYEMVLDGERRVEIMEKRLKLRPTPGLHEYAYISPIDKSAQPYYIYVPRSYSYEDHHYGYIEGAPMIVYLHGYGDIDKLNWQMLPSRLLQLCEDYGYILVAPFGRSNTDFQGIGEQDVMHVTNLALREFGLNIRRDRIFLLGYSMGGMGAYTIAGHYPDRWAGVVTLAGRADYYIWKKTSPDELQGFKNWLINLEFGINMAENFRHVPITTYQGEYDQWTDSRQPTSFVKKLKGLGYDASYRFLPGYTHHIATPLFSTDETFQWMEKRSKPRNPKKVTYVTYSLKYNKAYWVTIDDFKRWGKRTEIDAEVTAPNQVSVKEANVAAFSIDPMAGVFDAHKPIVVRVGDQDFKFKPPYKNKLEIVLEKQKKAPLHKTPEVCGPIKDVYNKPFIFVYGTMGNPIVNKDIYNQADRSLMEWRTFVSSAQLMEKEKDPLLVRDRDLTKEQKEKYNLVLIGSPQTNSVLADMADELPIEIKDDHTFIVDGKKYTGENIGLNMIYPSPYNPDRYIMVKTGYYYGEALAPNHKYDMLPDYIIYSDRINRQLRDDTPNRSLCAGFFDKYWQLDKDLMWTQEPQKADEPVQWWRR